MTKIYEPINLSPMNADTILKYKKYTTPALKKKAITVFNTWIRKRDEGQPCINCGKYKTLQCGHYYAAGKFNHIRFHEHNGNGECLACNYYDSESHAHGYRPNLIKKIGQEAFDELTFIAYATRTHKDNRFEFIEVIEKYKTSRL